MISENSYPALVLNADYRPLSYFPLSLWSWHDALKAVFLDKVSIVAEYDRRVRSESFEMALPSIVCLKSYVAPTRDPAFTRFNIFLRDGFACNYCGAKGIDLTFDHVVPRCRGGLTTWENTTAACEPCNARKGSTELERTGMKLRRKPYKPRATDLLEMGRRFPPNYLHDSWVDYLYWETPLEP